MGSQVPSYGAPTCQCHLIRVHSASGSHGQVCYSAHSAVESWKLQGRLGRGVLAQIPISKFILSMIELVWERIGRRAEVHSPIVSPLFDDQELILDHWETIVD